MIEARQLTRDLRPLVRGLEADIKAHSLATEEVGDWLQREFTRATEGGRTGQGFESWREEQVTLSAVGWVLSCVFVRFCEDNGLIAAARLGGPGERGEAATDTSRYFFQQHPGASDREYLLWVFDEAASLPGMEALMKARDSRMHELPVSVDGATELLEFWRRSDPESGLLAFDFTDTARNTRFLGDLYQEISEAARKRYALLQTPVFIEEFILDRTLDPAIADFGLAETAVIDPACGSGHFLLGSFERLLARWREREPETNIRVLCQKVLNQVAGVDINPFAVAIAHFRLLVAALDACEIRELQGAPDFKTKVATGDSLLHGHPPGQLPDANGTWALPEHQHFYEVENREEVTRILNRHYAAVVANPPYITPKDPALRDAYRDRYSTCHGKYALSVPFMERLFDLAAPPGNGHPAGRVGQITSNSFMQREFGKKVIEDYLASQVDLEAIVDTSGASIPGHGTPTVILLGRSRKPVGDTVRGVLGIRGEPGAPLDPAQGKVWREIVALIEQPGTEGTYVSVEDIERGRLKKHPWSLQGGGAAEVKELMEGSAAGLLSDAIVNSGFAGISGMDQIVLSSEGEPASRLLEPSVLLPAVSGDETRDWQADPRELAYFPYEAGQLRSLESMPAAAAYLWPFRALLESRPTFSKQTYKQEGRPWWEWHQVAHSRVTKTPSIVFSEIATHNHFVLDRGGRVFRQTAPVIKLPQGSSEKAHFRLLGPLNSSAACFWMKQVFYPKGGEHGWAERYQHDSTKVARFPLPPDPPATLAEKLDSRAVELVECSPAHVLAGKSPTKEALCEAEARWLRLRRAMIALQEELDWKCYRLYGLIDAELIRPPDELPEVELGERAFEIVLARSLASGETESDWFERHGSTPVTEVPEHWPESYRSLVQRRIEAIETVDAIKLVERPEYKRRWTTLLPGEWEAMEAEALRDWLLDRLESAAVWPDTQLQGPAQISDRLLADAEFQTAIELFAGADAEPAAVVAALLAEESVPYLAALRHGAAGIEKRAVWERTWELQRAEDRGELAGSIGAPPKYKQSDFRSPLWWGHRGKLDVPKERFTSYPDAAADGTTLYGRAGWDHAQRAQGLAQRIVEAQESEGLEPGRILPLLAGLLELLPWLHQWHADPDPTFGMPLSDFYDTFLDERVRAVDATREDLGAWRPAEPQRKRRKAAA